jgi:hypothetical protein
MTYRSRRKRSNNGFGTTSTTRNSKERPHCPVHDVMMVMMTYEKTLAETLVRCNSFSEILAAIKE